MAEAAQYNFSLKEVAEMLLQSQGSPDGRWVIGFDMSVALGLFGPSDADARPGAMTQITGIVLSKAPEQLTDDSPLLVISPKVQATRKRPVKKVSRF